MKTWLTPSNVSELRSFLGFCGYYKRYIANFSEIARPLHKLTERGRFLAGQWTAKMQLKDWSIVWLSTAPVLAHPDVTKPFILDTDASGTAICAVLLQVQDGREKVIAFASRSLTKAERKYCVTRKELLAVLYFTKYFKHYLSGKQFLVRTDHSSLQLLLNFKNSRRTDGEEAWSVGIIWHGCTT